MKKHKLFIFLLLIILCMPFFALAESCDEDSIKLVSVDLENKSKDASELTGVSIEDNKLVVDLSFLEVEDFVTYKLVIHNDADEDYDLNKNIPSSDGVITYTLESSDDDSFIKAGEDKEVLLTVKYNRRVDSSNYSNGVYTNDESIKMVFSNVIEVPDTGNSDPSNFPFIISIILLIISILLIARCKYSIKNLHIGLFILAFLIIPNFVRAMCVCTINISPSITISKYESRDLVNVVKEDAWIDDTSSKFVTGTSGINFLAPSSATNGTGKYIFASTKNEEYPIVYYRGNVEDNNVLYANYCWKILRTTEKNGLKLIYNGTPTADNKCLGDNPVIASNVKYNNAQSNVSSFGYMIKSGHAVQGSKKITSITNGSIFSYDVSYVDGAYTLTGDSVSKDSSFNADSMTHHHYTCFGADSCTTVNFIFMERSGYVWYVKLSGGETIDDVIENDIVNIEYTEDSNVKTVLDEWFVNNLSSYVNDLDDSVWCNDKSIASKGGWDKDGVLSDKLTFNANYRSSTLGEPSLECSNPNDRFTVSSENGNGKLTYPIGLITLDEGVLSGFSWMEDFDENDINYLYSENPWWTMSPSLQSANYMYQGILYSIADNVTVVYVNGDAGGVKPSITLKSEKKIKDGDGTKDNPFTIIDN